LTGYGRHWSEQSRTDRRKRGSEKFQAWRRRPCGVPSCMIADSGFTARSDAPVEYDAFRASDSARFSQLLCRVPSPTPELYSQQLHAFARMKFRPFRGLKRSKFPSEESALLVHHDDIPAHEFSSASSRGSKFATFIGLVLGSVLMMLVLRYTLGWRIEDHLDHLKGLPKDPHEAAKKILDTSPVIVSNAYLHNAAR
jgi:hypothetical protein